MKLFSFNFVPISVTGSPPFFFFFTWSYFVHFCTYFDHLVLSCLHETIFSFSFVQISIYGFSVVYTKHVSIRFVYISIGGPPLLFTWNYFHLGLSRFLSDNLKCRRVLLLRSWIIPRIVLPAYFICNDNLNKYVTSFSY